MWHQHPAPSAGTDPSGGSPGRPRRARRRWVAAGCAVALAMTLAPATATAAEADDAAFFGRHRPSHAGTAVSWWNEAAGRAAIAACLAPGDNPLLESRMYAMASLAVHDALNAIDRESRTYAAKFRAERGASPDAAVAAAAHDVMVAVIPQIGAPVPQVCRDAGVQSVETDYRTALAGIPDGAAEDRGVRAGRRAAAAILELRKADHADTPIVVTGGFESDVPGRWRFTPGTGFAFAPGWGQVTPFGLRSADQFRVADPKRLTSDRYTADFNEIKALGGGGETANGRTADQSEIALFWLESSPLAWNRMARTLAASADLDQWEQARLYGLLNVALADGYIASFSTKYQDLFWRPVTAIQEAATDGNPNTEADPTWTPYRTTPPIPDHDSAHAVEGGAAAAVFRRFFHTDRMTVSACSLTVETGICGTPNQVTRTFTSFSQAAAENAESRVLIGFHFRWATEVGLEHGDDIGRWTSRHLLQPGR